MVHEQLTKIRELVGVSGVVLADGKGIVKFSLLDGNAQRIAAVAVFLRDTMQRAGEVADQGVMKRVLVSGESLRLLVMEWKSDVLGIVVDPNASVAILEDRLRGYLQ
jgi:predicted regulator of Ras-like GTPase activity (Roadblock/LC7/MglB family)